MTRASAILLSTVQGLDNGFHTPPLGFNPWNVFGRDRSGNCKLKTGWCKDFDDAVVREAVQGLLDLGLAEVGYTMVGLDCGWTTGHRDSNGDQEVNATKFPYGIKALSDHIHDKGLTFGIYSSASKAQCCHAVIPEDANDGSLGYEVQDAERYAEYGVDYLKYDGCGGSDESYPRMRDGLNLTGRQIFLSNNGYGPNGANTTNDPRVVSNAWRTTGDDDVAWIEKLIAGAFQQDKWAELAGPGAFNDADMLEVGNPPLTEGENRAHFFLWCAIKSPLLLGCDVTNTSHLGPGALDVLRNTEAIAVNQDPLVVQARLMWRSLENVTQDVPKQKMREEVAKQSVWTGPLTGKAYTALLLNADTKSANISLRTSMLWGHEGALSALRMRDIGLRKDLGNFEGEYSVVVPGHDAVFLRLSPQSAELIV
jgi:alpha-galactosidase